VKLLLGAKGIDVNQAEEDGATALYFSSEHGHVNVVKLLLGAKGIDVNKSMSDGQSPLFVAAYGGHANIVALLLEARTSTVNNRVIDPSPIDSTCSGLTPLGAAFKNNHDEAVQLLTDAGAQ
jgi:ankyrin repeat protein